MWIKTLKTLAYENRQLYTYKYLIINNDIIKIRNNFKAKQNV